jgi:hypothetical protein
MEKKTAEEALSATFANSMNNVTAPIDWATQHRSKRNHLLKLCDWTQIEDCSLSDEKKQEWRAYRQALRDISTQESWPTYPVWPNEPI